MCMKFGLVSYNVLKSPLCRHKKVGVLMVCISIMEKKKTAITVTCRVEFFRQIHQVCVKQKNNAGFRMNLLGNINKSDICRRGGSLDDLDGLWDRTLEYMEEREYQVPIWSRWWWSWKSKGYLLNPPSRNITRRPSFSGFIRGWWWLIIIP